MPRLFTVLQLRDRVRELADVEGSRFLTDTEMNKRLSSAYAKYYCKLVKAGIGYPSEITATINSTGVASVALPADHFSTLRVDFQVSVGSVWPLEEIDVRETQDYQIQGSSYARAYRLAGGNLIFYPTPATGGVYFHVYAPAPDDLTSDSQTVDGVAGWEDAIILDAAIRCRLKTDDNVQELLRERDIQDARIDEEAEMRSLTRSRKIVRRHRSDFSDPSDWPPWVR